MIVYFNIENLFRIYGKGPAHIKEADGGIREFLKFETSSKSFKNLPVKSVTSTVDGIILESIKPRA
jgi:hypothetical protein